VKKALLACAVAAAVTVLLVAATRSSARSACAPGNCAAAQVVAGSNVYEFTSGSCQRVDGDFMLSIAATPVSFLLISTPKGHGGYRSVVWRYSRRSQGALLGPKIQLGTDALGQRVGTFSGLSTKGVRVTGSFSCG
jgi:hypothetical protein